MAAPDTAPPAPGFGEALAYWFRLGWVSFGGPAGQIALMHQDLVERRRWISERRFLHALNYCMLLPGPEAQQLATYLGWLLHRTWGGVAAGVLFVLPSFLIIGAIAWAYLLWGQLPAAAALLYGVKPAVVAIVVHAAWRIGRRTLRNRALWAIAAAAFLAIFGLGLPFPWIVLGAALAGHLGGRLRPALFSAGGGHGSARASYGPAVIDDDTPPPSHARYSHGRLLRVLGTGVLLWAGLMGFALMLPGQVSELMGWFFTKAALLTFGGAYAVLPYVYQGAVATHAWLTPAQMIDGLALGETTPGPLIMVVAFVGFLGGWGAAPFGADLAALGGWSGAAVATLFTFLPSFVFILGGAPLVEATRDDLKFTAPLTGITAAVVGVIVNLGVFFAWHVLWPAGQAGAPFAGGFEWPALLILLAATAALLGGRLGVMPVLGLCALVGAAWRLAA